MSINGRSVDAEVKQVRGDGKEYEYHLEYGGTTLGEIHFTEEEDSIIIRHLHNSSRNMQTSDRLPGDCYDGVGAALINILKSGKKKIVARPLFDSIRFYIKQGFKRQPDDSFEF